MLEDEKEEYDYEENGGYEKNKYYDSKNSSNENHRFIGSLVATTINQGGNRDERLKREQQRRMTMIKRKKSDQRMVPKSKDDNAECRQTTI